MIEIPARRLVKKRWIVRHIAIFTHCIIFCGSFVTQAFCTYNMNYEELPFVVLMCSYNAAQWVEKNLTSVAAQQYSSYRIVYVDDGSEDGTSDCVRAVADALGLTNRLTLISHKKRRRKLANMYDAIHQCADHEIVILLDGDDWLENDPFIFKKINAAYHQYDAWFTYSQYRNEPASEAERWGFKGIGYSACVPESIKKMHSYRMRTFVFMHLRTFYAWLFKQIKLADLLTKAVPGYRNNFYPAANDLAIVFPMVEMAHDHVHFMPEILYVRNVYSDIVGFKVDNTLQQASSAEIRTRLPYAPLTAPQAALKNKAKGPIDACVFFTGDMDAVRETIATLKTYVHGLRRIIVFYHSDAYSIRAMRDLKKIVSIEPYAYGDVIGCTLAQVMQRFAHATQATYLLMCAGPAIEHHVHIKKCAQHLEKTGAYGFYLINEIPPVGVACGDGVHAWQFNYAKEKWQWPFDLGWALYRAADIGDMLSQAHSHTKQNDIRYLSKQTVEDAIGLVYTKKG